MEFTCECICHDRGLNPWVESCPRCLCLNPKYSEDAEVPEGLREYHELFKRSLT